MEDKQERADVIDRTVEPTKARTWWYLPMTTLQSTETEHCPQRLSKGHQELLPHISPSELENHAAAWV